MIFFKPDLSIWSLKTGLLWLCDFNLQLVGWMRVTVDENAS